MKTLKSILGIATIAFTLPVHPATITIVFTDPNCQRYETSADGKNVTCVPATNAPVTTQPIPTEPVKPPPTTKPTAIVCDGFEHTRVWDVIIPKPGAVNNSFRSSNFGAKDAFVFRFKAPELENDKFGVSVVMSGGSSASFHAYTVATKPCIFDSKDPSVIQSNLQTKTAFTVNLKTGSAKGDTVPGEIYYLNVSHRINNNEWACTAESCNLLFTFTNPN